MTIKELIEELKKWPLDSVVLVEGVGNELTEVDWFYEDPTKFGVIINDFK